MKDQLDKNFIYEHELTLYPYAPLGLLHNQGEWPKPLYQYSIVVFIYQNNDNAFVEWINHHKNLGFDHFYIYYIGNNPLEFYRNLLPFINEKELFITFHYCEFKNSLQLLYFHFIRNHSHETKWHLVLDNNDIIYLNHKKSIKEFIQDFTNTDVIYFNLLLYGHQKNTHEFYNKNNLLKNEPRLTQLTTFTRMLVRSQIYPYYKAFEYIESPIYYHIHHLYPDIIAKNVLQENMQPFLGDFPNDQIYINNFDRQHQILNTAYCLRFDHFFSQQTDKDTLKKCDQFYFAAFQSPTTLLGNDDDQTKTISIKKEYLQSNKKIQLKKVNNHFIFPPEDYPLLSLNKPCQQSSAPENIDANGMAGLLVSGKLQGRSQAFTRREDNPWWFVDLQKEYIIYEIRLFHGLDYNFNILTHFVIESSLNGQEWTVRYTKNDHSLFGGANGQLYRRLHPVGFPARWIRIVIPGSQKIFSLDQVQIFGHTNE